MNPPRLRSLDFYAAQNAAYLERRKLDCPSCGHRIAGHRFTGMAKDPCAHCGGLLCTWIHESKIGPLCYGCWLDGMDSKGSCDRFGYYEQWSGTAPRTRAKASKHIRWYQDNNLREAREMREFYFSTQAAKKSA
jgi:hypothetical protein